MTRQINAWPRTTRHLVRIQLLQAALVAFGIGAASPAVALTIVRFEPAAPTVDSGSTLAVDIVADFSDPIVAFGFDIGISPGLLALQPGTVVGPLWIGVFAPDGDGLAGLTASSGIAGTGVLLATVQLRAGDVEGLAQIVGSVTPGDLTEGFGLVGEGFDEVVFEPASITVIPEASTLILVSAGVALLGGARRVQRSIAWRD